MTAEPCIHGDVPQACLDCLTGKPPERPNPAPARAVVVSRPFRAVFPGDCAGCGLAIHEGQRIVRLADDTHRHETCTEDRT